MRTKWFIINKRSKTFRSLRMANTLAQAWQKTTGKYGKWKLVVDKYIPIGSCSTCGLCDLYNRVSCHGCPVRIISGKPVCRDTPYPNWVSLKSKDNAIAELEFLKDVKKKTYRINK